MDMSAQCTMRCLGEGKCIVMIIEMIFIMGGRMGGNLNIDLPISANESEEPGQKTNHPLTLIGRGFWMLLLDYPKML